jgi:hypothetical protein
LNLAAIRRDSHGTEYALQAVAMSTNAYRTNVVSTATRAPIRPSEAPELVVPGALFWAVSVVQFAYALAHGQTGAFELTLPFLAVLLIPVAIWKEYRSGCDEPRETDAPRTGAD